jgi:hypothetical protein
MSWKVCFIAGVTLGTLNAISLALVPDRPAPPTPEKPQSPRALIVCDWQDVNNPNHRLRITPTETIFFVGGQIHEADGLTATHTIDWTASPFRIELRPRNERDRIIPGVFKLEGDRLKFGLRTFNPGPGKGGPVDFSNADTRIEYQRVGK